jgi:ABC-2 type transport system permease protein
MNLADLFIMAVVYNNILSLSVQEQIKNYFNFFAPGLAVTGLFASAFMIGREINLELRRDMHHYFLCLPMTRIELAVGRILSGGLRGMIFMSPLLLTCFVFVGFPSVQQLLMILTVLLVLAVGISGLSISIAVSTSRLITFITARGLTYYTLFFSSSVFYPLSLIKQLGREGKLPIMLANLSEVNPLTIASDMIRSYLLGYPEFSIYSILNVFLFSAIFTFGAAFTYIKIIERK